MIPKNSESLLFSPVSSKKVEAVFDGGRVTSDAGVLVLREVERQVGVISTLARAVRDQRDPRYTDHSLSDIITQRVNQIACGYEDANDSNELRSDPAFKLAAGRLPASNLDLASQPTVSRLENSARRTDLLRMAYAMTDVFCDSYAEAPQIIVLDFDDTEDETHGQQELALFNGYYDSRCYLPLHIYEGLSGKLIGSILHPGKRLTGKQVVAILSRLVKKIRCRWPETLILFRGDSHFCAPEVLKYCDENGLEYCIGLASNAVLNRQIQPLLLEMKELAASCDKTITLYEDFRYQADSWDKPRRVAAKLEVKKRGDWGCRFVVTSLAEPDPAALYRKIYSPRGQTENYIKDHKVGLKSDRTSCHSFTANQFRLFLSSAAYVLLQAMRENLLKGTQFARAQFDTIRLKLLKIGARVSELKTKIKLHLPSAFANKPILVKACSICCVLAAI